MEKERSARLIADGVDGQYERQGCCDNNVSLMCNVLNGRWLFDFRYDRIVAVNDGIKVPVPAFYISSDYVPDRTVPWSLRLFDIILMVHCVQMDRPFRTCAVLHHS